MTPEQFNKLSEGDLIRMVARHILNVVPAVVTPKHPPRIIMHRAVLDAGGLAIESKDGTKYRIRGRVFDTLESAWDTLTNVSRPKEKTLLQMRDDLRKIGWTMNDESSGPVVWTRPCSGFVGSRSIYGTLSAWNYVFGDEGA